MNQAEDTEFSVDDFINAAIEIAEAHSQDNQNTVALQEAMLQLLIEKEILTLEEVNRRKLLIIALADQQVAEEDDEELKALGKEPNTSEENS